MENSANSAQPRPGPASDVASAICVRYVRRHAMLIPRRRFAAALGCALLPWAVFIRSSAATAAPNHVLQLNGDGGHVELPAGIFNQLETATVEGWVKWIEF